MPDHRRDVQRARQVVDHRVEQRLHTLVLERRAAQHREDVHRDGGLANAGLQLRLGRLGAFEVQVHDRVVGIGNRFDQRSCARSSPISSEVGRNLFNRVLRAHRFVVPQNRLHRHQVDDAGEFRLCANLDVDRHRARAETVDNRRCRIHGIRAGLVHLVDEANARHLVLISLAPHGLRLRLHTGNSVKAGHRAVEHTQRALHLSGKVHVARRIDDVDALVLPGAGRRGRRDRDAALLLLLHPVHGRGAFVHFADAVGDARIKQNALGRRRLTGVDVRHDPDVPATIARGTSACHVVVSANEVRCSSRD